MSRKGKGRGVTNIWSESDTADAFELGLRHAIDIARNLGVPHSTVSREMKRRGCIKGRRSGQTVKELEVFLARQAQRRVLSRREQQEAATQARAATDALIDRMMRTIIAADNAGDLSKAAPRVEKIRKTLDAKPLAIIYLANTKG